MIKQLTIIQLSQYGNISAVDKTPNMEHSGTSQNIPEHQIIIIIMQKICTIKFLKLK